MEIKARNILISPVRAILSDLDDKTVDFIFCTSDPANTIKESSRVYNRIPVVRYNRDYMLRALYEVGKTYAERLKTGFDMYY